MLKVEHLQKRYKQFSLNCSLEIKSGYVTGLIGQNGAGKSTTFKAILGLISIDGGAITLLGKEIENFTAKDKEALGVVLSDSGFSGYLTIRDIVPVLEHLYHKFDKYFFLEQVKKYNLPLNKKIKEFSTGMKAKLILPFVISLFSLSTISYDEFDNGNAFLFSLPISRKDYVKEKYLLSFLLGFGALILGLLIICVAGFLKGDTIPADIIWAALIILSSLIIIQAIMLPFQLKYGPEKARIALMGTFGLIFVAGVIFVKLTQAAGVGTVILAKLSALHVGIFAAAITLIAAIFLFLSMQAAIKIVEKKEF